MSTTTRRIDLTLKNGATCKSKLHHKLYSSDRTDRCSCCLSRCHGYDGPGRGRCFGHTCGYGPSPTGRTRGDGGGSPNPAGRTRGDGGGNHDGGHQEILDGCLQF